MLARLLGGGTVLRAVAPPAVGVYGGYFGQTVSDSEIIEIAR